MEFKAFQGFSRLFHAIIQGYLMVPPRGIIKSYMMRYLRDVIFMRAIFTRFDTSLMHTNCLFLVLKCISINLILTNETREYFYHHIQIQPIYYTSKIIRMCLFPHPGQSQHSGDHRNCSHIVSYRFSNQARYCKSSCFFIIFPSSTANWCFDSSCALNQVQITVFVCSPSPALQLLLSLASV